MTAHPTPTRVDDVVDGRLSDGTAPTFRPHALRVEDVMTRDVVTVAPTAGFREVVDLMRGHGVSALPVVGDTGALLGIVSEADLLPKENPPGSRRGWVPESKKATQRRHRAEGVSAGDIMSMPAVSIGPRASLAAAARHLERHGVRRLVVLDTDGQLVGIVSRRDLLACFSRSDAEIRRDIVEGVIPRWLWIDPAAVTVEVQDGVVRLGGVVDLRSDADILTHLVRGLDGVVDVDSSVHYRWNDRSPALSRELHVS
jgi:CBS-domain-containing membrane protein